MKLLKLPFASSFVLVVLFFSVFWTACQEPCVPEPDPKIGSQSFTVEYKTPDGENYLKSIYNKANITVYVDFDGGERPNIQYTRIEPGYADNKFGPFHYTEKFYDSTNFKANPVALLGRTYRYDYYIEKDTYGTDKFTVEFLLALGDCNEYWASIKYYRNDEHLSAYDGQFNPAIEIVE